MRVSTNGCLKMAIAARPLQANLWSTTPSEAYHGFPEPEQESRARVGRPGPQTQHKMAMTPHQHPPERMMVQLTLTRRVLSDRAVLRAMEELPRDQFVDAADRDGVYRDSALPIACGQTI